MACEISTPMRVRCPSCGKQGNRVAVITVHALLREEYRNKIDNTVPPSCGVDDAGWTPVTSAMGWRFCDSSNCDVVYFSEESKVVFTRLQLRVTVGVKETCGKRPLCYCFGHSMATIKEEIHRKGRCTALADIREKMNEPGCRCEIENPSGSCCLGRVAEAIEMAKAELERPQPDVEPSLTGDCVPSGQ